jgi:hypothetical protein
VEGVVAIDIRAFAVQFFDRFVYVRRCVPHRANSFAVEQEVVWIDVTRLNEAAGLLGTAAGVGLVNQAAL